MSASIRSRSRTIAVNVSSATPWSPGASTHGSTVAITLLDILASNSCRMSETRFFGWQLPAGGQAGGALKEMGVKGLHSHDLRHTGNTLAAQSGAGLADLKARMGHDSDRAALVYRHTRRRPENRRRPERSDGGRPEGSQRQEGEQC